MTDKSPRIGLGYVVAGQDDAEVTVNGDINQIDALLSLNITDRLSAAPAGAEGACYIVSGTPGGSDDWAGYPVGAIAQYVGGAWQSVFVDHDTLDPATPAEGTRAWIADEKVHAVWTGSDWELVTGEAVFSGYRATSDQAISSTLNVAWNATTKTSAGAYTHSTSTNPEQITIIDSGNYEVSADVTVEYVSGSGEQQFTVDLTANAVAITGAKAYGMVATGVQTRLTVGIRMVVALTAGQVLRVLATHVSGGGSIEAKAGGTRITVRRV